MYKKCIPLSFRNFTSLDISADSGVSYKATTPKEHKARESLISQKHFQK